METQDFRTGYYTLASPKALFVAQLAGSFVGVLFAPAIYKFYTTSFPIGKPGTQVPAPSSPGDVMLRSNPECCCHILQPYSARACQAAAWH